MTTIEITRGAYHKDPDAVRLVSEARSRGETVRFAHVLTGQGEEIGNFTHYARALGMDADPVVILDRSLIPGPEAEILAADFKAVIDTGYHVHTEIVRR